MKVTQMFAILAASITLFSAQKAMAEPLTELRLGSVAMDTPVVMHRRLTPLTQYLSDTLGIPVTLKLSPDMKAAIGEVTSGTVDITYLTPVAYIKAHKKANTKLVAKILTDNEATFQLMIVVPQNSPIKTVAELAGKRFALGDKGALLQRATVVSAGMPLEKLGSYDFVGHYDNIARGVMSGDFDAGVVKDTTARKFEGKGLRVIYASPDLPPYNIAATKDLDDVMLGKITKALLALDIKNPAHQAVIRALEPAYTGFVATTDSDYEVVRKLIAPFEGKE